MEERPDEEPDLDPGLSFEDLDTWQLETLETCVARLDEAGWKEVRDWHNVVRSAGPITPKPLMVARRFRAHVELGLELWFYDERAARFRGVLEGEPYIRLRVSDKKDAVAMGARLYFGERLDEVLDALIAHQSTLDLDTYEKGLMVELEPICDEVVYDQLEILTLD